MHVGDLAILPGPRSGDSGSFQRAWSESLSARKDERWLANTQVKLPIASTYRSTAERLQMALCRSQQRIVLPVARSSFFLFIFSHG